jgi:hypothetical protein
MALAGTVTVPLRHGAPAVTCHPDDAAMTNTHSNQHIIPIEAPSRPRARIAAAVALLALAGVLAAVAMSGSAAAGDDIAAITDGEISARIAGIHPAIGELDLDQVDVLSGDDAREAAIAAGFIEPGDDVPNDVFIADRDGAARRLRLTPTAKVSLIACPAACESTDVPAHQLLDGTATPLNGDHAVFTVTVSGGHIVAIHEVYLP